MKQIFLSKWEINKTKKYANGLLIFSEKKIQKVPMTFQEWKKQEGISSEKSLDFENERMRIENKLQVILGKLSLLKIGDPEYIKLDEAYRQYSEKLRYLS